jgi:hypothetical protein
LTFTFPVTIIHLGDHHSITPSRLANLHDLHFHQAHLQNSSALATLVILALLLSRRLEPSQKRLHIRPLTHRRPPNPRLPPTLPIRRRTLPRWLTALPFRKARVDDFVFAIRMFSLLRGFLSKLSALLFGIAFGFCVRDDVGELGNGEGRVVGGLDGFDGEEVVIHKPEEVVVFGCVPGLAVFVDVRWVGR